MPPVSKKTPQQCKCSENDQHGGADMDSITKKCTKCNSTKEVVVFSRKVSHSDGLNSWCKKCVSQNRKPKDKELRKQSDRVYREQNKEKIRIKTRDWQRRNTQKVKEYHAARKSRVLGSVGRFTSKEWIDLCNKYDNKCLCCNERKKLTPDHVIPLVLGGKNSIDNIQPLCGPCNSRKNKNIKDYRP